MNIQDSVVLITSAGSLLGRTLAHHFASLGAKVVITDADTILLQQTALSCCPVSDSVSVYPLADYTPQSIQGLLDFVETRCGSSADVLINYWPSYPFPSLTSDTSTEDFSRAISMLASSLFSFGQASAQRMRTHAKNGVIINMLSQMELDDLTGYEHATSIVAGLTQSWARELTPFNIRVGGVVPAPFYSASNDENYHWAEMRDELIRSTEYIVSNEYFSGRVMAAEV
ncbi:short-chain dehydrogenase [Vibrio sp. HA2012]|uniref:SDR family oxidoreductase n=1 Tax=Vibrio sp. HA2012 TaxID=1971595 RepID=UPI000C2C1B9A|nr:SDR family oxidoreductase [Vibrio sp. HA2012]PJC88198.1 short-chain dehydrogenase [Vibrio sp. HA2012]